MLKNQWHLIEFLYRIYKLHSLDLKFIDIISLENVCYLPYNLQVIDYFVLVFIPSTCQVLVVDISFRAFVIFSRTLPISRLSTILSSDLIIENR